MSPGTYYFSVSDADDSDGASGTSDSVGVVEEIKCYIVAYKNNELIDSQFWANCAYDFYKISDPQPNKTYNCMGYAIEEYDDPTLGTDTIVNISAEMAKYGWNMIDWNENSEYDILLLDECIIGYGGITTIQHFSKLENGIVTAKMDAYEVVQHTEIYAYHNPGYNTPVKYFVRAS